jgi:hypothetical protein
MKPAAALRAGGRAPRARGSRRTLASIERDALMSQFQDLRDDAVMMGRRRLRADAKAALFLGQDAAHRTALLARCRAPESVMALCSFSGEHLVLSASASSARSSRAASGQCQLQVHVGLYAAQPERAGGHCCEGLRPTHVGPWFASVFSGGEGRRGPAVLLIVDLFPDRTPTRRPNEGITLSRQDERPSVSPCP